MLESPVICAALVWLIVASPAPAGNLAAEMERLQGHTVAVTPAGYVIEDIAGEGKPVVGVVERRGSHLVLVAEGGVAYRLAGVLAKPRLAGPGYKMWALGPISGSAGNLVLTPYRIGILARPTSKSNR